MYLCSMKTQKKDKILLIILSFAILVMLILQIILLGVSYHKATDNFNKTINLCTSLLVENLKRNNILSNCDENQQLNMSLCIGNYIDSTLTKTLSFYGLKNDFDFALIDSNQNIICSSSDYKLEKYASSFNYSIPFNLTQTQILSIYYYNKTSNICLTILPQLVLNLCLIVVYLVFYALLIIFIFNYKNKSKTERDYINNIVHDIKLPISTIKLAVSSIKQAKVEMQAENNIDYLNIISQELNKLIIHIDKLKQTYTIRGNAIVLNKQDVDINEVIMASVNSHKLYVESKRGTIVLNLNTDESQQVNVDANLIIIALNNIIDNAIKYNDNIPKIEISSYIENEELCIKIKDNGIGIASDNLSKIFNRHYRLSTDIEGQGLGLDYANSIVKAHGGRITVDSKIGEGSIFIIILSLSKIYKINI